MTPNTDCPISAADQECHHTTSSPFVYHASLLQDTTMRLPSQSRPFEVFECNASSTCAGICPISSTQSLASRTKSMEGPKRNRSRPRSSLLPPSCETCRRKKVKCDKARPCSKCRRSKTKCTSPEPSSPKRSQKFRIKDLGARLARLESYLPQLIENDPGLRHKFRGGVGCVAISAPECRLTSSQLPAQAPSICTLSSVSVNLSTLQPSAAQMMSLWRIFKVNIDPVVRILHRPTTETMIASVALGHGTVSQAAEPLLFSIWLGVVESISQDECLNLFGIQQEDLLRTFQYATEQALARADVMGSPSLMTLQALALYIMFIRPWSNPLDIWRLTSTAVGLAQAIQLHREIPQPNDKIFEQEMRRRLWWHIFMLENRASEEQGVCSVLRKGSWDIPLPSNVNDGDFYPGMSKSLRARTGATEMTFALTRFETNIFSLKLNDALVAEQVGDVDSIVFKDGLVAECRHAIQERYLKHVDRMLPLLRTTATIARLSLAKLWLVAHGLKSVDEPSEMVLPGATKDRLFTKALQIIEAYHTLSRDKETTKWHWLLHTYVNSQILALILSELCVRDRGPEERRAWWLINEIWYDDGFSNALWQASLRRLFAEAQSRMVGHIQPATWVQTR